MVRRQRGEPWRYVPGGPQSPPSRAYILPCLLTVRCRGRSLFLGGPPYSAKTSWARSGGKHSYFGGRFNVNDYNPDGRYHVFDDFCEWKYVPNGKCWFGSQLQFVVGGKYERERTIKPGGAPSIYIFNSDNDPRKQWSREQREYFEATCDFIWVNEKLY